MKNSTTSNLFHLSDKRCLTLKSTFIEKHAFIEQTQLIDLCFFPWDGFQVKATIWFQNSSTVSIFTSLIPGECGNLMVGPKETMHPCSQGSLVIAIQDLCMKTMMFGLWPAGYLRTCRGKICMWFQICVWFPTCKHQRTRCCAPASSATERKHAFYLATTWIDKRTDQAKHCDWVLFCCDNTYALEMFQQHLNLVTHTNHAVWTC